MSLYIATPWYVLRPQKSVWQNIEKIKTLLKADFERSAGALFLIFRAIFILQASAKNNYFLSSIFAWISWLILYYLLLLMIMYLAVFGYSIKNLSSRFLKPFPFRIFEDASTLYQYFKGSMMSMVKASMLS